MGYFFSAGDFRSVSCMTEKGISDNSAWAISNIVEREGLTEEDLRNADIVINDNTVTVWHDGRSYGSMY